ncbi:hypothetical protein ECE50_022445 [Chitinophaga sp. Mgbs1]|uniref:Uncharacterized protein n=1 Tax=Chitinophaga solisilvae TaxID=1233460 RepID=A0A3S1AYG8_9BACT|nr:hypothetical protein [Chitinophaga solisilvae]
MAVDINISNYEGFLLSYVDNELTEEERHALENFLQKHPSARQELDVLQGIRLVPDETLTFANKAMLYRKDAAEADYEALMCSFIDGELSSTEEADLKSWLLRHPEQEQQLARLTAVKLQPDTSIVFDNKAALYKQRTRTVRMHPAVWWGATAAAVLAGIIIWMMPAQVQQPHPAIASGNITQETMITPAAPSTTREEATPAPATATADIARSKPERATVAASVKESHAAAAKAPAADQAPEPVLAAAAKTETPALSQLPPPRNTTDEVIEKHLQQHTTIAAVRPIDNNTVAAGTGKEPLLAANIPAGNTAPASVNPAPTPEPAPIKGELIMSVSGSDSRILDKVTNVAKFFSRRKSK